MCCFNGKFYLFVNKNILYFSHLNYGKNKVEKIYYRINSVDVIAFFNALEVFN